MVAHSDLAGGAARAAYRLHQSLSGEGHESRLFVREKSSDDWTVTRLRSTTEALLAPLRARLGRFPFRWVADRGDGFRSANWIPSHWSSVLDGMDSDLIHLHWIGSETLSIEDVGRIRKPLVWTVHDMWPFCGTEHYAPETHDERWRRGYDRALDSRSALTFDVDRWVWRRKKRSWSVPMQLVAPTRWMADCLASSALMRDWPIATIPYALDTQVFKPLDRGMARKALNLPHDAVIVMFGAIGGGKDRRKGYDLLMAALASLALQQDRAQILCCVFGQSMPEQAVNFPVPIRWLGHIQDDVTLALLYGAADLTVVPSRQDNLPQTALEAQACGCPVVAFNTGGLPDAVVHGVTGYLATPFDAVDLASGIFWVLEDQNRRFGLARAARARAVQLWSPEVIAAKYVSLYREILQLRRAQLSGSGSTSRPS
jgi:glycosyltransferase involved in cell wall biosynthesis